MNEIELQDMNTDVDSDQTLPPEFMEDYDHIIRDLKEVDVLSKNLSKVSSKRIKD